MILLITMLTIKILFTINSLRNYFFNKLKLLLLKIILLIIR